MRKTKKINEWFTDKVRDVQCEYGGQNPEETEIQKAYASDT